MQFTLPFHIAPPERLINHTDKIMLIGSCFTEHISNRLEEVKFDVIANPNGILFNPLSVANSLINIVKNKHYNENDLFYLNEIWNCWDFHSRFSHTQAREALTQINNSIDAAHHFIAKTDLLIITLGSAFQYYDVRDGNNIAVANCHRAPAQWFEKRLLNIDTIISELSKSISAIRVVNPNIHVLFTISPVRHIRDGVVENNRSKARLIEAVHGLTEQLEHISYFPAYELAIDVLRDYRFYDIDMVHPNYAATQFIWEQFSQNYFDDATKKLTQTLKEIYIALNHKPRFPDTEAHKKFEMAIKAKITTIQQTHSYIRF